MKKYIVVILILAAVVAGGGYYYFSRPKSAAILAEIRKFVDETNEPKYMRDEFYRARIDMDMDDLYMKLVDAYDNEKHYDLAINILLDEIDSHAKMERDLKKKFPKTAARYANEAIWYRQLVTTYTLMGDKKAAEDARQKSEIASDNIKTAPIH